MIIRSAEINDADKISSLIQQLTTKYIIKDCTKEGADILLNSMRAEIIESQLLAGDDYYLAEESQQLVGVIGIKSNQHLFHLFVEQTLHHQGIAGLLWNKVISQKQYQNCSITVNSSLNALGFYQKLGFVAVSSMQVKRGIPSIPMKIIIN